MPVNSRPLKTPNVYRALIAVAVAAISLWQVDAGAETLIGQVVKVSDGDTLTVLNEEKQKFTIRLAGIDAPERTQDFGRRSTQSLGELVHRRQVTVNFEKQDRYGRIVGKVVADGVDINLLQVGRGMAWHYKAYAHEQSPFDRVSYGAAEDRARAAKAGLWSHPEPLAPWEFRQKKSEARRKE